MSVVGVAGIVWHHDCEKTPHVPEICMIDREKVLTVLNKRFAGATPEQCAAAANAIVGLDDEWEDVTEREPELGYHFSVQCTEICYLADLAQHGAEVRVFVRRSGDGDARGTRLDE
jgi:hypothetical protein